ncbi:MAG: hypothetical protein A3D28_00270 [Omnitrophica bacterium RIFCSPHIGHO2_02_FULL_63_14]|nr:MAG: hypothetical protein A3D28_00270 [Omnitrophica bacterium RIFCSPHIGHO2_02_FULL_63_14]
MQLLVFTECFDAAEVARSLAASGLEAVLYLDVNDPRGVGILFMSEDPSLFTGKVRSVLAQEPFRPLKARPEFTMLGRTYALGHEKDPADWLLKKPRRNVFNEKLPWAVWYPLRRRPEFETLSREEQREVLMEHAKLGMAFGEAGLAHDVRLACYGLDASDNEFVLGLVSPELGNLSKLIQDMRKTKQTSRYIQRMGPFFVGKAEGRFGQMPKAPGCTGGR